VKRETRGRSLRRSPEARPRSSSRSRSAGGTRRRSAPQGRRPAGSSTRLADQPKDELLRRAAEADIEGRSTMTKAQLMRALARTR
jgi:DNA end-binding protein Ku